MGARLKTSRRRVITVLVDMLEAGETSQRVAQVLAAYLVENRQVRNLDLYIRDIELMVTERFGIATAYVTSAKELSEKAKTQVERLVKAASGAKKVEMVERKDPSLIGGIVVRTADAELDGSVRTKLRKLRSI